MSSSFDPETKQQSMDWRSKGLKAPRKLKKMRRSGKVTASIFWDLKGILMIDYLEEGKSINEWYYPEELVRSRECIKKRDEES